MTFIKTTMLSGVASALSMVLGFVLNKVLAVYIGPVGIGLLGQFQNFLTILQLWATGGVTTGIVKYTSEFREDKLQKHHFWSMGMLISLVFTLVCSIFTYVFAMDLSLWLLKKESYAFIFEMTALIVFFTVLNQFFLSVLNGQKEIKKLLSINVATSVIKLALVWWLTVFYGIKGSLAGMVLVQVVIFFITMLVVYRSDWLSLSAFRREYDPIKVRMLFGFTLMALVGGITAPASQFLVRDYIGEGISWDAAGHVQALWQISNAYLAALSTVLTIYFLPKLSEILDGQLLRREIFSALKFVLPFLVLTSFIVIFFRKEVILVMYSKEFLPMMDLFLWQFVGNLMKGLALLFSFLMLAKAMTKAFIATQIIFASSFVLLSMLFVESYGLIGATMGYALNYFIYLMAVVTIFILKTRAVDTEGK